MSGDGVERPWRLFVAVPLDEELRAALAAAVDAWRSRPGADGLRWTNPDGWHVTLAFLGATEASRVPALLSGLERAAGESPAFTLETGGIGGFPSARRARVAWYGVADPERRLRALAASVRRELKVEPGPFRGHLTLARARDRDGVDLTGWLRPDEAPEGTLAVDRLVLYRSHLGRGPAQYEVVAEAPLGAMVRA
ncbi:MAG: RNA 2',3'-cyclic phosphodiesterase [Candidatus Limnocylindria bacterium]